MSRSLFWLSDAAWVAIEPHLPKNQPGARRVDDRRVLSGIVFVNRNGLRWRDADGAEGTGYTFTVGRNGGAIDSVLTREMTELMAGEDADTIERLWLKAWWALHYGGRGGPTVLALSAFDMALWDLKARRAGLPLAKLLGAQRDAVPCYNTSGGYLQAPIEEVIERAEASLARGIGGIKLKVGQPDWALDLHRVGTVRQHLGEAFPLMVDANQQWDRPMARRMCRRLEPFDLVWIEEPLDCYDAEGHAELVRQFDTPIATGEMLTSPAEHWEFIRQRAADGPQVAITGLTSTQRRAARAGAEVFVGDKKVGTVTSGQPSPTLGHPVAIALLETSAELEPGAEVEVEIRGKRYPFEVTALPFYKRDK